MRQSSDALTVSRRVAHDLRSPAGVISSLAQLLSEELPDRKPMLDSIEQASREILSILDQTALVLRATYSTRPALEPVSLAAVIATVCERVRSGEPSRRVELIVPSAWPEVLGVAEWLYRIWLVLVANAWRHGGGRVELGWDQRATDWEFWVRDNGPGLPSVRLANPVPSFETLHAANEIRGLGLPLARRLAELMGGRLSYHRLPGGMTEFAFTLPAEAQSGRADAGPSTVLANPGRLAALRRTGFLNDEPVEALDEITTLLHRILRVPVVLVSLVDDRCDYFKSVAAAPGMWPGLREVALPHSFSRLVVESGSPLRVDDIAEHPLTRGNSAIEQLSARAYLGVPLLSPDGHVLGALCAIAPARRAWGDEDQSVLAAFSGIITRELVLREEQVRLQAAFRVQREERTLNDRLMQHSADCILVLDDRARLLEMNGPGLCLMEIEDFSAVVGREWVEFWPEESRARMTAEVERARSGETGRFQGACPTLRGTLKWWDVSVTAFSDGAGLSRFLLISRDVTREKESQRLVAESEARFRAMANHMSQFAWMADRQGWIFWYNQRWLDYTGLSLEEMQGWGWKKVHHPDHVDRVVEKISGCFERGEPWEDTFPLRGVDGGYRWFLSRAVPIRDSAGAVLQWFGTNTDITEQLAVEEQLRKASRAKDQFIAILSHELRTPLNPALLIASEAASRPDLPESVRADFETIRSSVEMEARLIDDLLDLTRMRHAKLALVRVPIRVDLVVAGCLTDLERSVHAKGLRLAPALESGPVEIEADELRLRQIFSNVLRNAVKFTAAPGEIHVRTELVGGCFHVEVRDTGIGMSAEEVDRAFEPFAQGEHATGTGPGPFGGLGLGLAIAQTLVQLHGGKIGVSSRGRGQGTRVTISLPLPARRWNPTEKVPPSSAGRRDLSDQQEPLRVLVVDDHAATRETVALLLKRRGHSVRVAASVREALALLAQDPVDLVLSDLGLPDGRGDDLMRSLRKLHPDVLGVALSGYGLESDVQASLEAGFCLHLTKPVALEDLMRALQRVHGLRGERATTRPQP